MSAGIDWPTVKQRLRESQLALERALNPSPESKEAIFRERAAQLARRRTGAEETPNLWSVLVFTLGKERYGLDVITVAGVFPFAKCAPVPGAPPQLLGVTHIGGEIRSVIDLSRLLELPDVERLSPGYVLLAGGRGRKAGLRVDGIEKIQQVSPDELAMPADNTDGPALRHLRGLTPDKLRVLSAEALFDHSLFQ